MKINNEILAVLSKAEASGNELRLTMDLDRKTYLSVNKVIEAAGGKWDRKSKSHIFSKDASERLDEIILTGEVELPKEEFNYFPTPAHIVSQLIDLADIQSHHIVLEPSAGRGAIAGELAGIAKEVHCIELQKDNFEYLMTDEDHCYPYVSHADFLEIEPSPIYDRIVMNPPFAKRADIKHVIHAFNFLKNGGKLISIMGSGVKFREDRLANEFKDLVYQNNGTIEDLPEGSFKESGTMVNTVIVTICKS